ncbi:MAG: CPBP family intramembrane metalloprotease [Chitinivibrionales bacterium]|nr:CPBP family intramembrane metalloprotease [Chitinivibrionales bacterium]
MNSNVVIFCTACICLMIVWSKIVWLCDKKLKLTAAFARKLLLYSKMFYENIYSIILTLVYWITGILAFILFAIYFKPHVLGLFSFSPEIVLLSIVGAIAEISVISLINQLITHPILKRFNIDIIKEIDNVYWIDGLSKLPSGLVVLAPGISGFIEESVFRGVIFIIAFQVLHFPLIVSILLTMAFFTVQQLLQVQTIPQASVIGISSICISLIGSLLVYYSGSIIPAAIAHGSFALFYVRYTSKFAQYLDKQT